MIAVIQRVTHAHVTIREKIIGKIGQGILALIGIEKTDTEKQADRLLEKILTYRVFNDTDNKMNLSVKDVKGGLLLVSQFTIVADTQSGTRPGFSIAMQPDASKKLFTYLMNIAKSNYPQVSGGEFGANMQVSLCNDGPVTFILKS
jgi:D-tyrosyl-tRNA(Tyr) deacylase